MVYHHTPIEHKSTGIAWDSSHEPPAKLKLYWPNDKHAIDFVKLEQMNQ